MPLISFSVFKDKILSGAKRQTIRSLRKNPIKEGETLYLWWKQRSPQRERLGDAKCVKVSDIEIYENEVFINNPSFLVGYKEIKDPFELDLFAIADGFDDWDKMKEFFQEAHGLPFAGVLIEWDSLNVSTS